MTIFIFGNPDYTPDSLAIKITHQLKPQFPQINFQFIKPNQDLPFVGLDHVIIMDAVMGIKQPTLITEKDLDKLALPPRASAHDYDLAFQLKYLTKLGKLKKITIIGLPLNHHFTTKSVAKIITTLPIV